MSRKTLAKSQEPKAKSPKTKVVKWEYVTKPFDVKVLPSLITRLHSPLTPWLSSLTENCYVHLRPCVQGVDEDGAVVKYLYCTRNGRFFVRGKEGWNEILPNTASGKKDIVIIVAQQAVLACEIMALNQPTAAWRSRGWMCRKM